MMHNLGAFHKRILWMIGLSMTQYDSVSGRCPCDHWGISLAKYRAQCVQCVHNVFTMCSLQMSEGN